MLTPSYGFKTCGGPEAFTSATIFRKCGGTYMYIYAHTHTHIYIYICTHIYVYMVHVGFHCVIYVEEPFMKRHPLLYVHFYFAVCFNGGW